MSGISGGTTKIWMTAVLSLLLVPASARAADFSSLSSTASTLSTGNNLGVLLMVVSSIAAVLYVVSAAIALMDVVQRPDDYFPEDNSRAPWVLMIVLLPAVGTVLYYLGIMRDLPMKNHRAEVELMDRLFIPMPTLEPVSIPGVSTEASLAALGVQVLSSPPPPVLPGVEPDMPFVHVGTFAGDTSALSDKKIFASKVEGVDTIAIDGTSCGLDIKEFGLLLRKHPVLWSNEELRSYFERKKPPKVRYPVLEDVQR
jgi:hypothetical protein